MNVLSSIVRAAIARDSLLQRPMFAAPDLIDGAESAAALSPEDRATTSIIPSPGPRPTTTPSTAPRVLENDISNAYAIVSGDTVFVVDPTPLRALTIQYGGRGANFTNNGTIWYEHNAFDGALLNEGFHNIVNNGLIYLYGTTGMLRLTSGINAAETLINRGSMFFISESGGATAFNSPDYWATVENFGLIAVQARGQPLNGNPVGGTAYGLNVGNTVNFTNHAGAQLLVEATDFAVAVFTNAANDLGAPIVNNSGLIEARATSAEGLSVGIYVVQPGYVPNTIVNSGTIRADVAIFATNTNRDILNTREIVRNLSSGVIEGHIDLGLGDDELFNDGFINGNVVFDDGNDVYSGSGGISGVTNMGFGNDRYTGGAWNDRVIGGRGDDVLTGNGGNDILVGGFGNDTINGGFNNDTLIGEWGNDTITTLGGDYVEGNEGNDRIVLGDYTFRAVHGGEGIDTLVLANGARNLELAEVLASGRVTGFEIIEMTGLQRLLIDAATARDLAGKGPPLRINGYDTDTVLLAGTWTQSGTTQVDGVSYARWINGTAEVLVRTSVGVQLASGQDFGGLDAIAGGTPAQMLGAEAGVNYSSAATLLLSHVVQGAGFTVDAREIFFSDGRDVFYADTATTLTNNGLIESYTDAFSAGIGIRFGGNATVINNGTIDVQQLAPQSEDGTIFYYLTIGVNRGGGNVEGDAPLQNNGLIFTYSLAGSAVAVHLANGVHNTGDIVAISENHRAIGVNATFASDVVDFTAIFRNTGTIYAEAGGFGRQIGAEDDRFVPETFVAAGVHAWGSLTNDGEIIAVLDEGVDPTLQTVGVYIDTFYNNAANPARVVNNGLIVGTTAITFEDRFANRSPTSVVNNGLLVGNVVFLDTNDTYDGTRGEIRGTVFGFGGNDTFTGGREADRFNGGLGNDVINGDSNVDTAIVRGTRSQYTITQTSTGVFQVVGPDGTDTLTAIEFLQFDDQTLRLRPGTGVTVNFNTPDRTVYQSAMNAIRDFDGNALGGNGGWLRIGQADVNGDGDVDQILVNREIGRFATVGTAPDGLVYFADHGWAGETRVAGIYIDPLVEAGIVQAGSDQDSQRRFQNDLRIENINRVLGANDYNRDGIHEVYFALTDGTAYLRALMHADGNIRYANYQSQQEVIDYLTANGFGPETYAGWFSAPRSGEAALQEQVDFAEASGLGRAGLSGADAVMPGAINPASLAFAAPALDDHLRAEFYG
ncbi:MAG: hypothetical protein RLZZ475_898 [Pseudomonadota bacterium]